MEEFPKRLPNIRTQVSEEIKAVKSKLRTLVASYHCLPRFSATSMTLNNLLLELDVGEYILASQRPSGENEPVLHDEIKTTKPYYLNSARKNTVINRRLARFFAVARIPIIARKIERLASEKKCEQILGLYPDITYLAGAALAAKRLNLPFFAWFHNTPKAMVWNHFYNDVLGLEKWIIRETACIFTISDAMRDVYRESWPSKRIETLPHPFKINENDRTEVDFSERPMRLLFTGGINESNANALGNIIGAIRHFPEKYQLHISTHASITAIQKRYRNLDGINYHGFLDEQKLKKLCQKSHVLLLPHGIKGNMVDIEYQTIFPTKTISYMMANRPIFAHVPLKSGIDNYLKERNVALVVNSSDPQEIRKGLDQIADNESLRKSLLTNYKESLVRFDAQSVAQFFRDAVLLS